METLENITTELAKKGTKPEDMPRLIQAASMLSMIEAGTSILNETTMATPIFRLVYDDKTQHVQFKMLGGYAPVPQVGALDVTMTDLLYASLFRQKLPINWEGKTGIGKTFTTEQFFKTHMPKENYCALRLNTTMTNVLQPYTEGYVENGMLKIKLKKDALSTVAAIFVDEVNRGDANQVLQLQDGSVTLYTGERGELGVPIPEFAPNGTSGKWTVNGDNRRPVFFISAQNPPATKDAKYSNTKRTDAAQNNRNLQVSVPNSAASIGASSLVLTSDNHMHERFKESYKKFMAANLDVPATSVGKLEDWIEVYAFTTDPKKTSCPKIQSSIEFIDAMLTMTAPNVKATFTAEQQIAADWNQRLAQYGGNFNYAATLTETAEDVIRAQEIVKTFEEEMINRDTMKVEKIADAVSMIRRVKDALASPNPVQTYISTPNFITVKDVACSFAVVLNDKQENHDKNPVVLVDQVLSDYTYIAEQFAKARKYTKPFAIDDPTMSVYNLAFQHAVKAMVPQNAKQKGSYIERFIGDLSESVRELAALDKGREVRKPVIARMIADVATLAGFADDYKAELEPQLMTAKTDSERRNVFYNLFADKLKLASTPTIYQHRLKKVLAV